MRLSPIALAFTSLTSLAEMYDGNRLLSLLRSDSYVDKSVGMGYVTGVYDATRGDSHCTPNGVTSGQITDMTKVFLEVNPSIRHLTGDVIVSFMLSRNWPCSDKSKKGGPGA